MTQISETITFQVTTPCDNPVQLRFKNRLGGFEYAVFDLKQVKTIDTDSVKLFRENTKYIESVRTLLSFYKKTGRDVWTLFSENIPTNDVVTLQELAISPDVGLYIGDLGSPAVPTYNTVIVQSYDIAEDTYKNRHNVSVEIRLLEIETLTNL